MTLDEMETVREGDLIVHKYKLKEWKRVPSLVVEVKNDNRALIMNPILGLVDTSLYMWEFLNEDR